jgi:hypothetical protein
MYQQIDLIDAQINHRPDGSIEILGQSGFVVLHAEYAKKIKRDYREFLISRPEDPSLKIRVNIEVPQPGGEWVNEG